MRPRSSLLLNEPIQHQFVAIISLISGITTKTRHRSSPLKSNTQRQLNMRKSPTNFHRTSDTLKNVVEQINCIMANSLHRIQYDKAQCNTMNKLQYAMQHILRKNKHRPQCPCVALQSCLNSLMLNIIPFFDVILESIFKCLASSRVSWCLLLLVGKLTNLGGGIPTN